ncbi:MAG: hypothetical protein R3E89_15180 [Thiolinea sp.]
MYNTRQQFGWVSILLHWVMAVILIGLYFVGDYMVELTVRAAVPHPAGLA